MVISLQKFIKNYKVFSLVRRDSTSNYRNCKDIIQSLLKPSE